jgi:hypothetical protein
MIRLDHSRLLKIDNDNELLEQIALADVITARTQSNEKEQCLWKRPTEEVEAGEFPLNNQVLTFTVQNVKDLRYLTTVVNRLKEDE